ncbi:MAG: caspase domain-containing protein [Bacteroidia bacterium]
MIPTTPALRYALIALMIGFGNWATAQTFARTYGGDRNEHAISAVQSRNGDFIVTGFTDSYGEGKTDIWVMRTDRRGNELWRVYMGDKNNDWPNAMIETRDGHIVIAGHQEKKTGTDDKPKYVNDAWVFKLDRNGEMVWSETFGGRKNDEANALVELADGSLGITGYSGTFSRGQNDIWVLRLTRDGDKMWAKNFGGKKTEEGHGITQAPDGDMIITGYTTSFGNGGADILVMKVDLDGSKVWLRNYGGSGNDAGEAITVTASGELLVAGWTGSDGAGGLDGTVLKLDTDGVYQWQRYYGQDRKDVFYSITPLRDGFAVSGYASDPIHGTKSLWAARMSGDGGMVWEKQFTGENDDLGHSISQTDDGGFLIAGGTKSFAVGQSDMWLIKSDPYGIAEGAGQPFDQSIVLSQPPADAKQNGEPSSGIKPNLYVLAIGISEYQDPAVNLTYAHIDAESLTSKFQEMEGVMFNQVHVRKVLNREATLVNIKTAINWLEREATQHDVIVMFVSSHGALDHKGNLYILPTDFNAYNLFATALNIRDLTEGINGVPCKKLVFLDACHSGQSGFDLLELASTKAADLDKVVQELIDQEPGLTVMTSSSGREYSYETVSWGHGAFTKAILEGLDGNADLDGDRVVKLNELDYYVSERVKKLTGGRQHPFTPINLFGNIPLFILE